MTIKSVIDIEVNDEQFGRFSTLFGKYQEALSKTPGAWAKAGKEQAAMASQFEKMTAAMMAQSQWHREMDAAARQQAAHMTVLGRLWHGIAVSTKGAAHHIKSATGALLHWGKILGGVSGLLGAGGLWGISRMASEAGEQRQAAKGVGMTIGERRAFMTDMARFLPGGAGAFASEVAQAQATPSKRAAFYALGINNPAGLSSYQLTNQTVSALWRLAHRTSTKNLGVWSSILGQYGLPVDVGTLRVLKGTKWSELQSQMAHERRDIGATGVSDQIGRMWQDFATQMHRAGASVWATFVRDLTPLEKPLEKLSGGFVHLVDSVMKSHGLTWAIDELGKGVNWLAKGLNSGSFQKAIEDFIKETPDRIKDMEKSISGISSGLAAASHFIQHPVSTTAEGVAGFVKNGVQGDINELKRGYKAFLPKEGQVLDMMFPWLYWGKHSSPKPAAQGRIIRRPNEKINLNINNNTGGSASVSISQQRQ